MEAKPFPSCVGLYHVKTELQEDQSQMSGSHTLVLHEVKVKEEVTSEDEEDVIVKYEDNPTLSDEPSAIKLERDPLALEETTSGVKVECKEEPAASPAHQSVEETEEPPAAKLESDGRTFEQEETTVMEAVPGSSRAQRKQHVCDVCYKTLPTKYKLMIHRRGHTGEKPYQCNVCGKSLVSNQGLAYHMRIHTGENKQYECNVCCKKLSSSYSLILHMRIHTGEQPYQCTECGKTLRSTKSFAYHMRIHTRENPYESNVCGTCVKIRVSKQSFENHMSKQQSPTNRSYQCDVCGGWYPSWWVSHIISVCTPAKRHTVNCGVL